MHSNEDIKRADEKYFRELAINKSKLEEVLSKKHSQKASRDIALALDEFFKFVTEGDALAWLANLYDAEIGGFYFSNSARDNEGFLPDLESTMQALGLLYSSRAGQQIAPTLSELLPIWLKEDIKRFVKKLQDPENGYFYHPQWTKEDSDANPSRLGRDLGWAVRLLTMLGEAPTYDTPSGVLGNGIRYDGVIVEKRSLSVTNEKKPPSRPHLESVESFSALLKELEPKIGEKSWDIGNRFEAEALQIVERDKQLKESGKKSGLSDILIEWFTSHQNPSNGAWTVGDKISYDSTNGLLKIGSTFNKLGKRFPRPLSGIRTAIKCIVDDATPDSVCHVLNPWYAVNVITMNVKRFSESEDEIKEVEALRKYITDNCPEMIRATVKKLSRFKVGDGSFIYKPNRTGISQGMRVAPDNVFEGDINATTIAARAIIEHVYDIIEYDMPPLYSGGDVMRFLNIIEEKKIQYEENLKRG